MWLIRANDQHFDANTIYDNYPTMFTIELHHGGSFTKFPEITYKKGKVNYVDLVDVDEFSIHKLDSMMVELGYSGEEVIYYHFRLPNGDLDFGLRALGNDADVLNLAPYTRDNKIIQVYTEHGQTNLLTYFMNPRSEPRVINEEIVDGEDLVRLASPTLDLTLALFKTPDYRRGRRLQIGEGSSCTKTLFLEMGDQVSKEANIV